MLLLLLLLLLLMLLLSFVVVVRCFCCCVVAIVVVVGVAVGVGVGVADVVIDRRVSLAARCFGSVRQGSPLLCRRGRRGRTTRLNRNQNRQQQHCCNVSGRCEPLRTSSLRESNESNESSCLKRTYHGNFVPRSSNLAIQLNTPAPRSVCGSDKDTILIY